MTNELEKLIVDLGAKVGVIQEPTKRGDGVIGFAWLRVFQSGNGSSAVVEKEPGLRGGR